MSDRETECGCSAERNAGRRSGRERHRQEKNERVWKSDGGSLVAPDGAGRANQPRPDPTRPRPAKPRPPEPMPPFSGWMKILEMDEKGTSRDEKCINWMNI